MTIEGLLEQDNRAEHLDGTDDILDIKLGEQEYQKPFILYADSFSLEVRYKQVVITKKP